MSKKRTAADVPPSHTTAVLITKLVGFSTRQRLQFHLPESMLLLLLNDTNLAKEFAIQGVNVKGMKKELKSYIDEIEKVPPGKAVDPKPSAKFSEMMLSAGDNAGEEDEEFVLPVHYLQAIAELKGSVAQTILCRYADYEELNEVYDGYREICIDELDESELALYDDEPLATTPNGKAHAGGANEFNEEEACQRIDQNPEYTKAPFVGREQEVRRSLMTLSKRDRGNIVFVGDHGVGKSTMICGIIQAAAKLPKKSCRIAQAHFYKINAAAIVTGTTYSDEIENHVIDIIDGVEQDKDHMAIIFADNMSELSPQNPNDSTPDTLRLLVSLTEGTNVHLVTTASFDQYKRLSTHNQAAVKAFTRIDINEPKLDPDARLMVKGAANSILLYHKMKCADDMLDKLIDTASRSWSKDIAMPGRALDLIDNLAALTDVEGYNRKRGDELTTEGLESLLKMQGYDSIAAEQNQGERLRELEPGILAKVFGQDEAVHGVAQSVLLAKAGLSDETKPLAAYLFVGPTGVGKTELARVLAEQLGVKLVRFDMSEYSEQHTVSKLVGSPAGYIGYDDGGLLTDAVRKNPNCVLLFDEIEKAHAAVFNLLLQTLDYAQLTDNKGQKADFSGTIIIMTSNAGARFATGTALGFGAKAEKSEVMENELKKTFAPEFLNRLTQIVAFHDMSQEMAARILDRKVGELQTMLEKKKRIRFVLTEAAREFLLKTGFSARYGAREMDRAIGHHLKPALMNALLFEGVQDGANLSVDTDADNNSLKATAVKALKK